MHAIRSDGRVVVLPEGHSRCSQSIYDAIYRKPPQALKQYFNLKFGFIEHS